MWHADRGNCLSSCLVCVCECVGALFSPFCFTRGNGSVASLVNFMKVAVKLKFQLNIKGLSMSPWLNYFPNPVFTFASPLLTYNTASRHSVTPTWWDILLNKRNTYGYQNLLSTNACLLGFIINVINFVYFNVYLLVN